MSKLKVLRGMGQLEYALINDLRVYESPIQPGFLFADSEDLIRSVCKHGVVEPIVVVTNSNEPGKYYIIDGVRRFRAAVKCGMDRVPVFVLKLDMANPEHVSIIDALSITLRYTTRLVEDSMLDMRIVGRVVKFVLMNIGDDALMQMKQGTIPSVAVNMLSDLIGISTSTAYRWIQRIMNEQPEVLISVLRIRNLIEETKQVETPQPPQQPVQPAQQTVVEIPVSQVSGTPVQPPAPQQAQPQIKVEVRQPSQQATVQPRDVIMCGGNTVRRDLYDEMLNDDEVGPYLIALCRKGIINNDVLVMLKNASTYDKRKFVDESLSILSNKVNIPVPSTTIRRISDIATLYRTSQQDVLAKLGMLLYAIVRIIEEDTSRTNKPVLVKLDEVARYAFGDIEELKSRVRSFIVELVE